MILNNIKMEIKIIKILLIYLSKYEENMLYYTYKFQKYKLLDELKLLV